MRVERRIRLATWTVLGLALGLAASPVAAEPIALGDESSIDRFAALVTAYRDTSRVRWVVEAVDPDVRERILDGVVARLDPVDRHLVDRLTTTGAVAATRSLASPGVGDAADAGTPARAWITIAPPPERPCSWRVTVRDDRAPGSDPDGLAIPLERGDAIPTSESATIEVGFSGPLQSTLYAFAETAPGALRDLAAAPDIAIPVEAGDEETLILVRARRPVPFLDGLRTTLEPHGGSRANLGRDAALGERLRNGGRGIGANIQLLDPGMVVAELEPAARPAVEPTTPAAPAEEPAVALSRNDLVETCLYTVTRLP
jgi:hypothetical protein